MALAVGHMHAALWRAHERHRLAQVLQPAITFLRLDRHARGVHVPLERPGRSTGAIRSTRGGHRAQDRLKKVLRYGRKVASNGLLCDSIGPMGEGLESLPDDVETLQAALIVARAEAAAARARQSDDQALIAHLKLQIEKLNRDRHGPRSE